MKGKKPNLIRNLDEPLSGKVAGMDLYGSAKVISHIAQEQRSSLNADSPQHLQLRGSQVAGEMNEVSLRTRQSTRTAWSEGLTA